MLLNFTRLTHQREGYRNFLGAIWASYSVFLGLPFTHIITFVWYSLVKKKKKKNALGLSSSVIQGTGRIWFIVLFAFWCQVKILSFICHLIITSPLLFPSFASVSFPFACGTPGWTALNSKSVVQGEVGTWEIRPKYPDVGHPRIQATWGCMIFSCQAKRPPPTHQKASRPGHLPYE